MGRSRELAELGSAYDSGSSLGFRNRIINGDMRIDQRNAGAVVTAEAYLIDRWRIWRNQTYNVQQSTDAPAGFSYSLRATKTSTTQSTYAYFAQYVEGFNFADMLFGTANAQTVTLSFWVKSSVTGTFTAGIANAANNRSYPATYTISSANTWEQKSITIAGDTTGTWVGSTNGIGVHVWFNFGAAGTATANTWNSADASSGIAGNANLGTTNGATFAITGVQLEAGSVATPFERRDYGRELMMCQRYCQNIRAAESNGSYLRYGYGEYGSTTGLSVNVNLFAPMRITPALTTTTASQYGGFSAGVISAGSAVALGADGSSPFVANVLLTSSGLTAGRAAALLSNNNQTSFLLFTAEL
jgi:hypothetical protein